MKLFQLNLLILSISFLFYETSSDSLALRRCCTGNETNVLDASPEFIFSDVLVLVSGNWKVQNFSLADYLLEYSFGDLSSHQTALSMLKMDGKDNWTLPLHRPKYSGMVVYGLDLHTSDLTHIKNLKLKETQLGLMKSTVILRSSLELIELPPEIKFFVKKFDISNKCHVVFYKNNSSLIPSMNFQQLSSFEVYQDIRGNVRMNTIHLRPYALTVSDSSVPYDFHNITIRATAVDSIEEGTVIIYKPNGDFDISLGALGLWYLRDTLNFNVIAMKAEMELVPEAFADGKVVGIARQLLENEADISILHSYHLKEVVKYLKPLSALGEDAIYAIFRQPPSFTVHNVFLKPFNGSVWIALSCFWTAIFLLLLAFLQIAFRFRISNGASTKEWEPTIALLWSVCTLCQRSFFTVPEPNSLRSLLFYGGVVYLILYIIYSAEIIACITADFPPISTIDELVENNFELISDPNMFYSYLVNDDSITKEDLRKKLTRSYKSDTESLRKVAEEGYSYHLNTLDTLAISAKVLNYSNSYVCKWYSHVPLGSIAIRSGFFIKRHSALQEPFNLKLVGMMERGLNHRYINTYYEITLIKCPKEHKSYREDLGLPDVIMAFGILALGKLAAVIFLIFENFRPIV